MNDMQWEKPAGGGSGRVLTAEPDEVQKPLTMLTSGGGAAPSDAPAPGAEGDDFSWVDAKPKKRTNARGFMLLLIVVAIGGGVLYGMRLVGGTEVRDAEAEDAAKKIDSVLDRLAKKNAAPGKNGVKEMIQDSDQIVSLFAADPTKKQVELDQLQKNPFELFVPRAAADPTAPPVAVEAVDRVKEEKLRKVKIELDTLKLQSLMSGNPPLAVISNKVVREGDVVGPFVVTAITPMGVRLTAEGNTYTLAMTKPTMNLQGSKPH